MSKPLSLTPRMRDTLAALCARIDADGIAPSYDELAAAIGVRNKSNIHALVCGLETRGWIRRRRGATRAVEILHRPPFGDVVLRLTAADARDLEQVLDFAASGSCEDPCELGETGPCTTHLARIFHARLTARLNQERTA